MKNKVFFSKNPWGDQYRPYLEIFFRTPSGQEIKYQGLVDTGADKSLIPYSLGLELGFTFSSDDLRRPPKTRGVGGFISSIERETTVLISHSHSGKIHLINIFVSWVIPSEEQDQFLKHLKDEIELLKIHLQSDPDERLKKLYKEKMNDYANALNILEPEVLIGREFMKNFVYLTFVHDSIKSEKSYFEYELRHLSPP